MHMYQKPFRKSNFNDNGKGNIKVNAVTDIKDRRLIHSLRMSGVFSSSILWQTSQEIRIFHRETSFCMPRFDLFLKYFFASQNLCIF
jgi:hypothetical protein